MTLPFKPYTGPPDEYEDNCSVCGEHGTFTRDRLGVAESFHCGSCRASLRYQGQARVILRAFARRGSRSIAQLVEEPEFRQLRIFEPGSMGPLRKYFRGLDSYERSEYVPDAAPGERRDGVRCEDLMRLSFEPASFDLVITSDIFEHVRHPYIAFEEVHRILRNGGMHVFTVPCYWPMRAVTVARVDVSGPEDVFLMAPAYHGRNREHLVYNDFGLDMLDRLETIGLPTDVTLFASTSETTSRQATFCSVRPVPRDAPMTTRTLNGKEERADLGHARRFPQSWLSRSARSRERAEP